MRAHCLLILLASLLLLSPVRAAEPQIRVLGLFSSKAVLEIDGQRRVLAEGQISPEGVRLISADSDAAVLEVNGKRQRMGLGRHIGSSFRAAEKKSLTLWPDRGGMYSTVGSVNGYTVNFLLDTGASSIAMNAATAKRMGINYRLDGKIGAANTASGVVKTYRVLLDRVTVGAIKQHNVPAVVIEGSHPLQVLLGMSFLKRLEMVREGEALHLKQKW